MPDNTKLLKELEIEQESGLLPTPPVGENVTWYAEGKLTEPRAAIVTRVEGPGRISLTIFPLQSFPKADVIGVVHCSHPMHLNASNPTTRRCGFWAYPRELAPFDQNGAPTLPLDTTEKRANAIGAPVSDYDVHRKNIAHRRQMALKDHVDPKAQPKPAPAPAAAQV